MLKSRETLKNLTTLGSMFRACFGFNRTNDGSYVALSSTSRKFSEFFINFFLYECSLLGIKFFWGLQKKNSSSDDWMAWYTEPIRFFKTWCRI